MIRFPRRSGAIRSWAIVALLVLAAIGYATGGDEESAREAGKRGKAENGARGKPAKEKPEPAKERRGKQKAKRPPRPPAGTGPVRARLLDVVDGDTIDVLIGGRAETVRYIGVDTPETVAPGTPVQCGGPAATEGNRRLLGDGRLVLSFGPERRDRYGRLLAYVQSGRVFVNEGLVRRGLARTLAISPNTELADRFAGIELRAARLGRGLWGRCGG